MKRAKTYQKGPKLIKPILVEGAKTYQKKILGKKLKTEMKDFIFLIFSHAFACIKPPV